jgi:outer membrane biosynthesis protein TonB
MDLEKIIKKDASKEGEGNTSKIPVNLKDKKIIIGGGIIGGLFLIVLLGKMFSGGETVQVQQGVGTKEVKTIVEESTKPLAEKLQQQEEINKQLLDLLKKQQESGGQKTEEKKEEKKEEPSSPLSALFPTPTPSQSQPQPLPAPQPTTPPSSMPSFPMPEEKKEPPKPKLNHKSLAIEKEGKIIIPEVNEGNGKSASSGDSSSPVPVVDENGQPVLNKDANANNTDNIKKKKTVYIPAGSMSYGTLLYSFTAPSEGMFPPVVIEIEKSAITANKWKVPIEKCFVLVKAQYDVSTERAILGGNDSILSCVLKNGKVIEKKVNIAVGEEVNGSVQMGLSGVEKWLTGEDFAKIGTLATAQGMASGLQQSLMTQSMTAYGSVMSSIKNRGEYAILSGINTAFGRFYDFWMKKYDKKVPAIEVSAPRPVFITFVNGVDLEVSDKDLRF